MNFQYIDRPSSWGQVAYVSPTSLPMHATKLGSCNCQRPFLGGLFDDVSPKWVKAAVYGGIAISGLFLITYMLKG